MAISEQIPSIALAAVYVVCRCRWVEIGDSTLDAGAKSCWPRFSAWHRRPRQPTMSGEIVVGKHIGSTQEEEPYVGTSQLTVAPVGCLRAKCMGIWISIGRPLSPLYQPTLPTYIPICTLSSSRPIKGWAEVLTCRVAQQVKRAKSAGPIQLPQMHIRNQKDDPRLDVTSRSISRRSIQG